MDQNTEKSSDSGLALASETNAALIRQGLADAAIKNAEALKSFLTIPNAGIAGNVMSPHPTLRVGEKTHYNYIYAGRYNIGESLSCDLFALPKSLHDLTGKYFGCDGTVQATAGLWAGGRPAFSSLPDSYAKNLQVYLRWHVGEHRDNDCAFSRAFIPWSAPLQNMIAHKLIYGRDSAFAIPGGQGPMRVDLILSCERPRPGITQVVNGTTGKLLDIRLEGARVNCALFQAAPVPA